MPYPRNPYFSLRKPIYAVNKEGLIFRGEKRQECAEDHTESGLTQQSKDEGEEVGTSIGCGD
jgi:hypothetical protein